MEYFQDAKTFVYNEQTDKVEYKRTYDHIAPERFLKVNRGSLDGDLLASLTTWTPQKRWPLIGFTGLKFSPDGFPDRINYIMSTKAWNNQSNTINIGVHNTNPNDGPVNFNIRVRDFAPRDVFPEDVRVRYDIICNAFNSLDATNNAWREREARGLI